MTIDSASPPTSMRLWQYVVALLLLLPALATAAEAQPQADTPGADDIEAVITRLEDPAARAELVAELKVLLESRRAAAGQAAPPSPGDDVVEMLGTLISEAWTAVTSVDPRQALQSSLLSLALVIAALALRWLLFRVLRRLYGRLTSASDEDRAAAARPPEASLPPTIARLLNLVITVLTVALIAESWGAGFGDLLQTDLGARIAEAALAIGLILILTAVLWNVSGLVVTRLLRLGTSKLDADRTARRLDTLVPLLRSVLQVTIGVLSGLLILSELGINIGPLLAGAGILGLAVGFGAQTLVKDLITGVTILLEDSASVGDVVEIAGHAGAVEEMRIRIIQLRDLAGEVHLIPYSEVTSIINKTKDFSYYLMDVGVAYRENTDQVCEILEEVCEELRNGDAFGADIQGPLEILGLNRFADSAVEIRARIRTTPGRQWAVGRGFNRRMKQLFDERGIEIPFPHTTLYFGEPKEGHAPPARLAIEGPPEADKA